MSQFEIAIIGGTGHLGRAIARRLAKAGKAIVIGSRHAEAAAAAASEIGLGVVGMANADAAAAADIVILAVPFAAQSDTLAQIGAHVAGKIVVDTTVPLVPSKVMRVQLPADGSAAQRAKSLLSEDVLLVSAFHNIAAHRLMADEPIDCDVLVFGDDKAARASVIALAEAMGLRGLHGGPLSNSAAAEALTSVLIFLNKIYSADGAGIKITGDLTPPAD